MGCLDIEIPQTLIGSRYHPNPKYLPFPAHHIAIRGIQEDNYVILEIPPPGENGVMNEPTKRVLEEIEFSRALFEVSFLSVIGTYSRSLSTRLMKVVL